MRICRICGDDIRRPTISAIYCSEACNNRAFHARNRTWIRCKNCEKLALVERWGKGRTYCSKACHDTRGMGVQKRIKALMSEGRTTMEVANLLGCSQSNVNMHIARRKREEASRETD